MMKLEGRLADEGTDADRLIKLLKEDKIETANVAVDTMKRCLSLGKRLAHEETALILRCWESLCQRDSLVDNSSTLRGVMGASDSDEEEEGDVVSSLFDALAAAQVNTYFKLNLCVSIPFLSNVFI